ncbi:hypothetical protein N0V90_000105 [Kalmusia sp. IMI 367209]|nr:hypothetical protein N0V90_000105 [Kalmusia sp. IMI 367209]
MPSTLEASTLSQQPSAVLAPAPSPAAEKRNAVVATTTTSKKQRTEIMFEIIGYILLSQGRLMRFLRISKALKSVVLEKFYRNNAVQIRKKMADTGEGGVVDVNQIALYLPRPPVRKHIRSLNFVISMEDDRMSP